MPAALRHTLWLALALLPMLACGIGIVDNQSGGSDHLPTQGAGPYGKLSIDRDTPADEPFVIAAFPESYTDPSALGREDGGFRVWFGRIDNESEESQIWLAEMPGVTELLDVPSGPALVADAAWEESWVGEPSVVRIDASHLVMFYRGGVGAPAIGRADSTDDGLTWSKHPSNPVLPGNAEPSAVYHGEVEDAPGFALYTTRPGRAGIFRSDSDDGVTFTPGDEPVLEPRPSDPQAFDRYAIFNPHVVMRTTVSGNRHYGLFFNAMQSDDPEESVSVGWAGSFDGVEWTRFANPDGPVLAPGGTSEMGPSVLLEPDRGIMFYSELKRGVPAIAVAMHP